MSLELARAYVQVVPSMQGVQGEINRTFGAAGDSGGQIVGEKARGGILRGAAVAGAGFLAAFGVAKVAGEIRDGLSSVVGKGIDRAVSIQNAQKKLEGLGHSAGSITKIMDSALASVKGTSFGLGDAATIAASAVAAGIKPGKELTAYLKTTADTATIAGGSLSDIGAILNKANTGTAVYSDTLNQLSDRGIPVFTLLAKHYGVNAAEFQKMVAKGQVSGDVLSKVLHDKIGGAALDSGKTAEGAYANIGAAFGRLGVQLGAGTAVERAPALFTSISNAIDLGSAAIKPLTDILNHQLALGFTQLTGFINGIDFTKVSAQVKVVASNVKSFLGGLQKPSSDSAIPVGPFAAAGAKIRGILQGVLGFVDSVVPRLKAAFGGVFSGKGINTAALGTVGQTLGDIRAVAVPLFPALVEVGKSTGGLAASFGQLIAAGVPILPPILNLLAGAIGFVADHMQQIVPFLPLIAAGFIAWRVASQGTAAANRLLTAAQLAALPVNTTNNALRLLAARTELQVAAAQGTTTTSIIANSVATARQTIATIASNVATTAMSVASKVAAAGQWLLNAALSANPIGIVVLAVAALIAGLVYFFTQTKIGQQAWASFTRFLGEAWANITAGIAFGIKVAQVAIAVAFAAIRTVVTSVLNTVRAVVGGAFSNIRTVVAAAINGVVITIRTGLSIARAYFTMVFNTIKAVVTAAINVVKTVVSTGIAIVKAVFSGNFAAIPGIVSGAAGKLRGIVTGLIGQIVGNFRKFGGDVLSAIGNMGAKLLSVGRDMVRGLVQGVQNAAGAVVQAISGVVSGAINAAKNLLGIHSPSRVFAEIGRYVGQGLSDGLAGSQDQVQTASERLVNGVTDAFAKLVSNREAAQKRLAKLNLQLSRVNTKTKAGRNRATDLRADISEQKAALAAAKAPGGTKGFVKALKADTDQIARLAGRRDQLSDQLKTAQDDLSNAVKVRDDFRDQVRATVIGLGDVIASFKDVVDARATAAAAVTDLTGKLSDLGKSQADAQADVDSTQAQLASVDAQMGSLAQYGTDYADKIAELQDKRNDLAGQLATQLGKVADYTSQTAAAQTDLAKAQADAVQSSAPRILSTLQTAITNTNAFRDTLATLRSQGVDDTTYSELLQGGVAGGGLQAAQELAAAGPGVVQQVRDLQTQLATAGAALGTGASTVLYQAGVDTAQASVDGIKSKIVDNQAAIGLLELAVADRVRTLGINTSALSKDAGKQFTAGLADGIYGAKSDLDDVIDALGKRTVDRLKKKLGIHSPSRVARDEIGQQFGLGMALGIQDMHGAVEQASAGLASVPSSTFAGGLGSLGMPEQLAPIQQIFNGPMGYTADELAATAAARARRALAGVNIPKVSVR